MRWSFLQLKMALNMCRKVKTRIVVDEVRETIGIPGRGGEANTTSFMHSWPVRVSKNVLVCALDWRAVVTCRKTSKAMAAASMERSPSFSKKSQ